MKANDILVLIPDYVSTDIAFQLDDRVCVAGYESKSPEELKDKSFLNAANEDIRIWLMQMVNTVKEVRIISPSLSFYRYLSELDDTGFFVDLVLRFMSVGANIEIDSGLLKTRIPQQSKAWLKAVSGMGIKIKYRKLPSTLTDEKPLVVADDVKTLAEQGIKELIVRQSAIVTPAARDTAKEHKLSIITTQGDTL